LLFKDIHVGYTDLYPVQYLQHEQVSCNPVKLLCYYCVRSQGTEDLCLRSVTSWPSMFIFDRIQLQLCLWWLIMGMNAVDMARSVWEDRWGEGGRARPCQNILINRSVVPWMQALNQPSTCLSR